MASSEVVEPTPPEPLDNALARLAFVSRVLQACALLTLIFSTAAVVLFLLGARFSTEPFSGARHWLFAPERGYVLVSTGVALFAAVVYEFMRRRGDVLFDEISDELQWFVQERNAAGRVAEYRPNLDARIILREFAHASELPFLPGRHGPAICVLLNMIVLVLSLIYAR